jgi:hypothetical protein
MEVSVQIHALAALQLGNGIFKSLRLQLVCSPVIVCNVSARVGKISHMILRGYIFPYEDFMVINT